MWGWKVLIEQLLLVTLSRQKRLQFLFLRFGFGFCFRFQFCFQFRIPAFPYALLPCLPPPGIPLGICHFFSFLVVYSPLPVSQKKMIPHPQAPDQPHTTCQLSQIQHQSPGLLYRSPYLPDKVIFWAFLWLSLRCSPFLAKTLIFHIHSTVFGAFLHLFSHWQRLFLASKWWSRILTVCTSCKTSYNVLSHSHIYWGGGG